MFTSLAALPASLFIAGAAVLGLILGSFYNVCMYRWLSEESILFPPSHCPLCKARLRWWELVPVLSWLGLRGRCGHCRQPISARYPLVELTSGLVAALLAWKFGPTPAFAVAMLFAGLFLIASGIDFMAMLLPDVYTLGGAALALPCAVFILDVPWQHSLLGGLLGAGLFWLVLVLFKRVRGVEGLGFGDVKLMLPIGFLCGPFLLPLILIVAGFGAMLYAVWLALRGRGGLRVLRVPFGPFLCLGWLVTVLAGMDILRWWIGVAG